MYEYKVWRPDRLVEEERKRGRRDDNEDEHTERGGREAERARSHTTNRTYTF